MGILTVTGNDGKTVSLGQNAITVDNDPVALVKDSVIKSGSRGNLAGYEDCIVSSAALTITQTSPDSQQVTTAVAITVNNGTANSTWTKKVSIKNAFTTVNLGTAWVWAGGSAPTMTAPSLLVLSWDNDVGFAVLQTTG